MHRYLKVLATLTVGLLGSLLGTAQPLRADEPNYGSTPRRRTSFRSIRTDSAIYPVEEKTNERTHGRD